MGFCKQHNIAVDSLFNASLTDLHLLIECFIDHVRFSRLPPIQSSSIDGYLTHVSDWFTQNDILSIPHPFSIRSKKCSFLLHSYYLEDYKTKPARQQAAIPITYNLLCDMLDLIYTMHFHTSPRLYFGICAACAIGYACSLRTGQYLKTSKSISLDHQLNSSHSYFWLNDTPYNVCDLATFPSDTVPDAFTSQILFAKNDKSGISGPKGIVRCTSVLPQYDCCTVLFRFLQKFIPLPNTPLLSAFGSQIEADLNIRPVLFQIAKKYGFDPKQLRIHGSFRSGAMIALENESDAVRLQQGCWTSIAGMSAYLRSTLKHATYVSPLIHDLSVCPTSVLQNIYVTKHLQFTPNLSAVPH